MTSNAILQLGLYLAVLLACVKPLGLYMARVYSGNAPFLAQFLGRIERTVVSAGLASTVGREMTGRQYATALLMFSLVEFPGSLRPSTVPGCPANQPGITARRVTRLCRSTRR